MFSPIATERLLLRPVRSSDAEALAERRSDPEVALWQSWDTPYPLDRAAHLVADVVETPDPVDDAWWMLTIADLDDTTVHGDLALRLTNNGRIAEVGYTLARGGWGRGIATEAVAGLLGWLFDAQGVTRVTAMVHPDNLRSARVLERCGFDFEGHTRNSYWDGAEASDDWIYGLTPDLHADWAARPRNRPKKVELVEPYPTGLRNVIALRTHKSQERFVSPIAASLAQVAVPPIENGAQIVPWPRVIHADGEPAGFVMMAEPTETERVPYLWRLLIDRRHQRRGIGARVVDLVIDQARAWGGDAIKVSWVPGVGSPEPLYLRKGFVPTGEIDDGEIVAELTL